MALCTRCGQQTEGAAEFCSNCGVYLGSRESDQPQTVAAMVAGADYLRPFAPEVAGGRALPAGDERELGAARHRPASAGDRPAWQPAPPSGVPDSALPPPDEGFSSARGPFEPARHGYRPEEPPASAGGEYPGPAARQSYGYPAQATRPESYPASGRAWPPAFEPASEPTPDPYPAARDSLTADYPAARDSLTDDYPAARDSLTDDYPAARDSLTGDYPAARDSLTDDYPPARDSLTDDYSAGRESRPGDYAPGDYTPGDDYGPGGYPPSGPAYPAGDRDRYSPAVPAQWQPADDAPYDLLARPLTGYSQPRSAPPRPSPGPAGPGLLGADPLLPPAPAWPGRDQPSAAQVPPDGEFATSPRQALRQRGRPGRAVPGAGHMQFPQESPPPARRPGRAPRNGRWISVAAAAVVLIICAASAVILLTHGRPPAKTASAGSPTASPQRPRATPSPSASQLITVEPAAASGPDSPAVVSFLARYFTAINRHDFASYRELFSTSLRSGLSAAAFTSGYGTSTDSHATLHSITTAGPGELSAAVTFTSHQQPADSLTHSACTTWTISLYLIRQGHGYVIVSPPAGYQASFSNCS